MAGRKPGTPKTGGRQKGSVNKTTAAVKDALTQAFSNMGGIKKFTEWGRANPRDFYGLWVKMLPAEQVVTGSEGGPVGITVTFRNE